MNLTALATTAKPMTVKPAIDRPLSPLLEDFLADLCWRWQEMPDRPRMTLQDFAQALRSKFKLGIPLMPQVHKFLADLGIGLEWRHHANGLDGSFDYNPLKARWEIYIPADLGLRESFVIMHEVFEVLAWRCYHRIPWWADWARVESCSDPHKKADEFAFLTVLPPQKFRNRAKKLNYDVWELSNRCQTTQGPCFQALTRFPSFPFPFFHALFSVDARPDQTWMFFENDVVSTRVVRKNYKKPTEEEVGIEWEKLKPSQRPSWEAVETFSSAGKIQNLPAKNECFELGHDDLVYQAKMQSQVLSATTDRIASITLDAPVDVIIRPKPDQPSLVYLQVLPEGFAKRLAADKGCPLGGT